MPSRSSRRTRPGPFTSTSGGTSRHFPVNPPQAYADQFKDLIVRETDFSGAHAAEVRRVRKEGGDVNDCMRRYLGDVLSMDDSVGRLLKAIDDLGLRDNTIVVFSSDHGAGNTLATNNDPADRRQAAALEHAGL